MITSTAEGWNMSASSEVRAPAGEQDGSTGTPRRVWIGRFLGPLLALLTYALLSGDSSLSTPARTTAAVVVLVAVWWMTEALPLPATSLIPIVAFPLLGILEIGEATAPFAHPTVFLYMGGFIIALAMQKWNLHKRIALLTMRAIGTRPSRLILGIMVATAFISMWVNNTATALMMLPIGTSVLAMVMAQNNDGDEQAATDRANFATALMLSIAYSASIGGLATLVGSLPNLIMKGFVEQTYGVTIGFVDWMKLGVPVTVLFLGFTWFYLTRIAFRVNLSNVAGGQDAVREELAKLGPMSRGEWSVLVVFVSTAFLWLFRDQLTDWTALTDLLPFMARLTDEGIAITAAIALFLIPVRPKKGEQAMDWRTAQEGIPWGVLLLFGGGLSLALAVQTTGLSAYIGDRMSGLDVLPTVLLVAAVCGTILLVTELVSNTATASTFLPVLGGVAVSIGIDPLLLLVPAALACTCSFMMPVGTPPNAIVFGSGYITLPQMVKAGVWLNIFGVLMITALIMVIGPWALGIQL
ncbi:SLC13 family permease [Streptomyces carpaticus]|uniref:SLC13 family permease n=1 Tax=Streptomyces TaxID=1883 RepID=UPI0021FF0C36|nr:SLC13 family permease [Streptomyces carpaticus]